MISATINFKLLLKLSTIAHACNISFIRLCKALSPSPMALTHAQTSHTVLDGVLLCAIYFAWQGLCVILHSLCLYSFAYEN